MSNILRVKRRVSGSPGAPSSLNNAELAFNEVDQTLWYGLGTGGAGGTATSIVPIGGKGAFVDFSSAQTITGNKTFTGIMDFTGGTAKVGTLAGTDNSVNAASTAWVRGYAQAINANVTAVANLTTTGLMTLTASGTATTRQLAVTSTARLTIINPDGVAGNPTLDLAQVSVGSTTSGGYTKFTVDSYGRVTNASGLLDGDIPTTIARLASPALTGTPTAPTPSNGDNSTKVATTAFVLATRLDQLAVPTATISMGNQSITNLADPVNPQDAATKNYVDAARAGLNVKQEVRVASTANVAIASPGVTQIDGVTMQAGDRVLLLNQTNAAENGIYVWNGSASAMTRATDANTNADVTSGMFAFVSEGTTHATQGFVLSTANPITLGTTSLAFSQFSGSGSGGYTAGNGLQVVSGNTLQVVGTANRINVSAAGVDISTSYAGQTSITTVGTLTTGTWNATAIAVAYGGTGTNTLTGYVKGNGTSAMTAVAQIPNSDVAGLGTMATQNATSVSITGGSITGLTTFDNNTVDGGTF